MNNPRLFTFDNKNNHSIVVRVDFGDTSFLFTGDMEKPAIRTLLDSYDGTSMLDVDVWHVGHHGSHNATTDELLDSLTLQAAVISAGKWNYGMNDGNQFTTWRYGHPRRATVTTLAWKIKRSRSQSAKVKVGDGVRKFSNYTVRRAIYGTCWDGTVKVFGTLDGDLRVTRNN